MTTESNERMQSYSDLVNVMKNIEFNIRISLLRADFMPTINPNEWHSKSACLNTPFPLDEGSPPPPHVVCAWARRWHEAAPWWSLLYQWVELLLQGGQLLEQEIEAVIDARQPRV